jgi:colanic acid/amylovoran biosynthesis protein
MKNKTILIDYYSNLNLGDDLFIYLLANKYSSYNINLVINNGDSTAISILERKNVNIFIKSKVNFFERVLNFYCWKISLIPNSWMFLRIKNFYKKLINKSDCYIMVGGSLFIENDFINEDHYLYNYKLDALEKKSSYIIGSNFGPYKNDAFLKDFVGIFKRFTHVSFRDLISYDKFSNLDNTSVSPDMVFSSFERDFEKKKISKSVGFSIINISNREYNIEEKNKYKSFFMNRIRQHIANGDNVYLFSFCSNEGDLEFANELKKTFSQVIIINYEGNIELFLNVYSAMESMYAVRFHAIILSILYRQNMVPISYSNKTLETLKYIKYPSKIYSFIELDKNTTFNKPMSISDLDKLRKKSNRHFPEL